MRQQLRLKVVLGAVVAGLLLVGLVNFAVMWWTREKPNYDRIEPGLYQGGVVAEPPSGTGAVLNLCESKDSYQTPVHVRETIPDAAPAPSLDWLRRQVEFVAEQRQAGRTVYVHCAQGVSRSGMVVVAYLMSEHRWSRDRALEYARSKRPRTRPNLAFMDLLKEWEQVVLEEPE